MEDCSLLTAHVSLFSGYFFDAAGVDTIRADENPSHLALNAGFDSLQIGPPDSFCLVVGVTDVVSYRMPLAAKFADSCHGYCLRILSIMSVVEWSLR